MAVEAEVVLAALAGLRIVLLLRLVVVDVGVLDFDFLVWEGDLVLLVFDGDLVLPVVVLVVGDFRLSPPQPYDDIVGLVPVVDDVVTVVLSS